MALLSSKGVYGLAAMFELAIHISQEPIQIKEISLKADIPQNYLEQLLGTLRKASIVKSIRGAKGGYILARDPKDITVREIYEALEGDLSITQLKTKNSALELFYNDCTKELEKIFDISLDELVKYQERVSKQIFYTI